MSYSSTLLRLTVCFAVLLSYGATVKAQLTDTLFFENFQQGMPADFLLLDLDQLTPEAQVSFVDDAWTVQSGEALGGILDLQPKDQVAISTSFYLENQGTNEIRPADDWMILPPLSLPDTGIYALSWRAGTVLATFPDQYEVRVSRSGTEPDDFTEILFETEGADEFLARKVVSLNNFQGESIRIAFRNHSLDKFLLLVDDIAIVNALNISTADLKAIQIPPPDEFSQVPAGQQLPFRLGISIFNLGPGQVRNISTGVRISDSQDIVFQYTQADTVLITPGDTLSISLDSTFIPQTTGAYSILYNLQPGGADVDSSNNKLSYESYLLSDTTWGRDRVWLDGSFTNATGYEGSPAENIVLAQLFENRKPDVLTSASALLYLPDTFNLGDSVFFSAYDWKSEEPTEIGRTESYTIVEEDISDTAGLLLTLKFLDEVPLEEELFFIGVHQRGENALFLAYTEELYVPFTNWIRSDSIPEGNWAPIELFEDSEGAPLRFVWSIQAHTRGCATLEADIATTPSDGISPGTAVVNPTGGVAPYQYIWQDLTGQLIQEGDTVLKDLSVGSYKLQLSDNRGCKQNIPFSIPGLTHSADPVASIRQLNIYPNPFSETFTLDVSFGRPQDFTITLLDINGKVLLQKSYPPSNRFRESIEVNSTPHSVCTMIITTDSGEEASRLILRR